MGYNKKMTNPTAAHPLPQAKIDGNFNKSEERDKALIALAAAKATEKKHRKTLTRVTIPRGYVLTTNPAAWQNRDAI